MKKFTALFLLMFALALNANADSKVGQKSTNFVPLISKEIPRSMYERTDDNSKNSSSQAVTFGTIFTNWAQNHSFYTDGSNVVLEPKTKNLYIVNNDIHYGANNRPNAASDSIYVIPYGTKTIQRTSFIDSTQNLVALFPSIGIINPGNNLTDAQIAINYSLFDPAQDYDLQGMALLLRSDGQSYLETIKKPTTNTSPAQNLVFSAAPITTFTENDAAVIHITNSLSSMEGSGVNPFHQGYYGYYGFDINSGPTASIVPEQWFATLFRGRDNAGTGGYQTPMLTDVDSKGNVYSAINNIFSDDINTRLFAFSKSTDNGKTWSAFKRIGADVLTAYAESQGYTSIGTPSRLAYGQNGFVVTGEDEMSYIFSAVLSRDQESTYQLIEVFYKGGNFGIRKVADLDVWEWTQVDRVTTFYPLTVSYVNTNFPNQPGPDTLMAKIFENSRGHEIQIARTLDGKDLIVKWVHNRMQKVPILANGAMYPIVDNITNDQGVDIDDAVVMKDSMYVTDIFVSYRGVNDISWHNPINITDDTRNDIMTQMPKFQESINKVFVTRYQQYFYNTQFPNFPGVLRQKATAIPGDIQLTQFDILTTGVEVEQAPTSYNFNLYDVAPNPATEQTNISYSLNTAALVNLEVFDAMGNKVATLFNGNLSEGFYATPYDVTALASGAYFYSLTVNGVTLTKTLNVVK